MKNLLRTLAFLLVLPALQGFAQGKHGGDLAGVDIHTNAVCDDCKQRIETEMLYEKGVQKVTVDLEKETIHVDYKAKKTDPEKLREAISKIGYLADDVQPAPRARASLPACCQMTREEHAAPSEPAAPPTPVAPEP